jgi:multiple sugar transport system substrate-binding protein
MRMSKTNLSLASAAGTLALTLGAASSAQAEGKSLTMCWAAWDPANALVELDKDFTKLTGIEMKHEFVPWTSYADHFINLLNSRSAECDLIIGDSQWIGGAAENKWYVKLNDFFDKNKISMDTFLPATVVGYAEWPKNTPNYWGLPAMADAVGWTYRKNVYVAARLGSPPINLAPRSLFADIAMPEGATTVGVRTEHAQISKANGRRASGRVRWVEHLGDQDHLHVDLGERDFITLADPDSGLGPGDEVAIALTGPLFFNAVGGRVRA